MSTEQIAHPPVVSQEEWLAARTALLEKEKVLTRAQDSLSAEQRRLPMVKIDKEYTFGDISALDARDIRFVLVSRAPLAKLAEYRAKKGWDQPWYSSFGSAFNYDFHVSIDKEVAPPVYNYRSQPDADKGEVSGLSVFLRIGDEIYHTYSTYARGGEYLTNSSALFDVTPYGRQEDWEDSPAGWPQRPTYG